MPSQRAVCKHHQELYSDGVRTVIDDVPRIRHDTLVVPGKRVVAGPRTAERVALQLPEAKLCLEVVCSKGG